MNSVSNGNICNVPLLVTVNFLSLETGQMENH